MKTLAVAVVAALLVPAAARAQPVSSPSGPGPDTYLELRAGGFVPQHEDLDFVDAGWEIAGAFGARFSPYLGVEAGVGYLRGTAWEPDFKRTFSDVPITATLRLRAPYKVAEFSLLGGVGLHVASISHEQRLSGSAPVTTFSDTAAAFGFHVGASAAFNLSPTMVVGFDVRRTFAEPKFEGVGARIDALHVLLALGYHF
jgi:opacity protein-like surface antigen